LGEKIALHLLPGEGGFQGPVYINLNVSAGGGEAREKGEVVPVTAPLAVPAPVPVVTSPRKVMKEAEKKKETPVPVVLQEVAPSKSEGSRSPAVPSGASEGSGGGGESGTGSGPFLGAGGGSKILAEIRRKIERSKRYPPLARVHQIEGIVSLSFSIESTGEVKDLQMIRSSGSPILDEEALATVKRAAPLPYYPSPIRISLKFSLEESD
jgi:protein TonB